MNNAEETIDKSFQRYLYIERYKDLLKNKTLDYFFKLTKGKLNIFELKISSYKCNQEEADESVSFHKYFGVDIDKEELLRSKNRTLTIFVDGKNINKTRINLNELLQSVKHDDEFEVFTCSCGYPKCTGINNGIVVLKNAKFVIWKAYSARRSRIYVFDKKQYRSAILTGIESFLQKYKRIKDKDSIRVYINDLEKLEAELEMIKKD